MNELERALTGDSAAAAPAHILEALPAEAIDRRIEGAPHTIYEELWHIAFWLRITLDWCDGRETPYPAHASNGFPSEADRERESWEQLCRRFFVDIETAAGLTRDAPKLDIPVRCPSQPGKPIRTMTVREQLESLAAHDAYHFGRIVLLRQLCGAWPPASGGFSW